MSLRYDRHLDRMVGGNSVRGAYGHGMHQFTVDELELGARVALELDDPEQTWWELHHLGMRSSMRERGADRAASGCGLSFTPARGPR